MRVRRMAAAFAVVPLVILSAASGALADDISSDVPLDVTVSAKVMSLTAGGDNGSTTLSVVTANGDGKNGCNLTGSTTLTVSVSSSDTTVATVSPSSVTFDSCGATPALTVTPHAAGSADISLRQTSNSTGGTFNLLPATFTVNVAAAPVTNTAPTVTIDNKPSATVEGNTTGGANVTWGPVNVSDDKDTGLVASCLEGTTSVTPGTTFFGLGSHTVTCSATDTGTLTGSDSFTVNVVDTTAPVLTVPGNITQTAGSVNGNNVTFTGLSASDVVDASPTTTCVDTSVTGSPVVTSGSLFLGTHVIECTASDASGNSSAKGRFTIAVTFDFQGFFAPVDNKVLNGMKAGSTAPIKFRVADASGALIRDVAIVSSAASGSFGCDGTEIVDNLETYATGSTALRYDLTADQFIYNWKSPKEPGSCYRVKIVLTDGTAHTADFQLK